MGIRRDHLEKNFNSTRAKPTQNQTPQSADLFAAARPATVYSKTDKIVSNWSNNRLVRSHFRDLSVTHSLSHSLLAPIAPRAVDYRDQSKTRLKSHTPKKLKRSQSSAITFNECNLLPNIAKIKKLGQSKNQQLSGALFYLSVQSVFPQRLNWRYGFAPIY